MGSKNNRHMRWAKPHPNTPPPLPIAAQLATAIRPHSLPTATQLTHGHTAYPRPHSLPTATQLTHGHTPSPHPRSLPTPTQLPPRNTYCPLPPPPQSPPPRPPAFAIAHPRSAPLRHFPTPP